MNTLHKNLGINPLEAGWNKEDLPEARRSILLKNYGNYLEAANAMRHLAQTSRNGFRRAAAEDAAYCLKMHQRDLEGKKTPGYYPFINATLVFQILLIVSAILS